MSTCLVPDKNLFIKIENKMKVYEKKLKAMVGENFDDEIIQGGAFVIIPTIIGVVINLFAMNNEVVNTSSFIGLRQKLLNHKGVKPLHIPNELDYNIDDERRRIQLFELLTDHEIKGKQLQIYNSYPQPRRDQVDIQRCLYILTKWFIDEKYGQRQRYDNDIKSVIYNLFSNYLYLIALVTYFVFDDVKKTKEKERLLFVFKYIYPNQHVGFYYNDYIDHIKLKRKIKNPPQAIIDPPSDEFSNENEYAGVAILKGELKNKHPEENMYAISDDISKKKEYTNDISLEKHDIIPIRTYPQTRSETRKYREQERKFDIIPMRTRSQTKKYLIKEDFIPPRSNWEENSHMLWKRKIGIGGTRRKTRKTRSSRRRTNKKE